MSLLESLKPAIFEIQCRIDSLNKFIENADKHVQILLSTAKSEQTDIQETVQLILIHVNKNINEVKDLQLVIKSLLSQANADVTLTAKSAISELQYLLKQQDVIVNKFHVLKGQLISFQASTSKQQPSVQQKEDVKTPMKQSDQIVEHQMIKLGKDIQKEQQYEYIIKGLQEEVLNIKEKLQEEEQFNLQQQELIVEIQNEIQLENLKTQNQIKMLQLENESLKQQLIEKDQPLSSLEDIIKQTRNLIQKGSEK
ncbi:hypothetical protein SS50377_25748 [Spironucleus salmonicida]|uniref:Uncharacterized protein n=1 Tax=Spironucleus salmonicida TaxID=348837 RepID=V6LUN1_9EUKA|nr:hypothetical protein SS50377_25748 [Spironucleus salmonicida]|eukprot:EST48275.1 Hypothetical protein SS50377_11616 [Spironucleus salmonicida]